MSSNNSNWRGIFIPSKREPEPNKHKVSRSCMLSLYINWIVLLLEGRNLADVHTRLKQKSNLQNFIQQEADDVQLNILNQESQRNVDIVNVKRRDKLEDFQQQVKDRNATEFKTWAQRATALENETDKRERFDRLKKLSVSTCTCTCIILMILLFIHDGRYCNMYTKKKLISFLFISNVYTHNHRMYMYNCTYTNVLHVHILLFYINCC